MTFRTLIRRSLRFHWRSHLGVVLGAAIGSAALIGALVVGDSVRESLREKALRRLGLANFALEAGDRFVSEELAKSLLRRSQEQIGSTFKAIFRTGAILSREDGSARANQVTLYAPFPAFVVPIPFFDLNQQVRERENEIYLNQALADHLRVHPGDELVVRLPKASGLSADAVLSPRDDRLLSARLRVGEVFDDWAADFALHNASQTPFNAFIHESTLTNISKEPFRPNVLAVRWNRSPAPSAVTRAAWRLEEWAPWLNRLPGWGEISVTHQQEGVKTDLDRAFHAVFALADAQAELRVAPDGKSLALSSERIFLDPATERAASSSETEARPILTYLVNLFCAGKNATPYSMVTAAGSPWTPPDMRDDEILVSQWLADDLKVKPGDEIAMSYFLPESGAKLEEATNTFRVRSIVPMEMPWADRTLMPDFPGIEKAESTSEWDAGFPLTYKVRPKDDEYWKQHRGTPKAFITLAAGQKMWGSRFGDLTAIRFPIPTNAPLTPALSPSEGARENRSPSEIERKPAADSTVSAQSRGGQRLSPLPGGEDQGEGERRPKSAGTLSTASQTSSQKNGDAVERVPTRAIEEFRIALEKKILANLKPEELGLRFEPVREQALKAAEESQDFGGLFLGFSFFVILAALLLMAMLFQFGLEQRAPEIGALLALGFTPKQVRKLLLREGVALAFLGGIIGVSGGLAYAKAMLQGLTTVWRDAVGASTLDFHFTVQTLVIGLSASVIVSTVTIWLSLRKIVKRPARELLVGEIGAAESTGRSRGVMIGGTALICAVGVVGWAFWSGETSNAESFFSAGSLVLIAGLAFASAWLVQFTGGPAKFVSTKLSFRALALHGCARRRKRSLSTVAMLACGSFLIVSIGVFRLDANRDATKRSSGTGGFALIGNTTMPVVQDLNAQSGRDFFALNERDLQSVSFVPFRVRAGDEASCLNLNAAQKPRLLGVKPEMLDGRFAFTKNLNETTKIGPWGVLERFHLTVPLDENEIPAIGDANSIQWAMHKKVGDTIDYVDERGQPFKVRIVGAVANSILQGQLIIDEAEFVKRFPGESGYRMFLIDAPSNAVTQVSATLSRAMQDVGLELTPAAQRLDQFNAVQNTYLGTFQVLGGLGLLLGSVGLGIVVLRNVLERRGELALLMAVGFRKRQVQRLLLMENGALLAAGLVLGVVAAVVAVLPAVLSPGAQLPVASLTLTLGAVLSNGALWTWLATRLALRGDLLAALRNE